MAKKARRAKFPAKVQEPAWTPQTMAKLIPAPWADWPTELQQAAQQIERGYRLRAGEMVVQAQDYARIPHSAAEEWTPAERATVRRYIVWRAAMERTNLPLSPVFDMVVFAVHPSQIVRFLLPQKYRQDETGAWALLRHALELWTKLDMRAA